MLERPLTYHRSGNADVQRRADFAKYPHSQYALDGEGNLQEGVIEANEIRLRNAMRQVVNARSTKQLTRAEVLDPRVAEQAHLVIGNPTYRFDPNFLSANVFKFNTQSEAAAARKAHPGCRVESIKKNGRVVGFRLKTQQYLAAVQMRRELTQSRYTRRISPNVMEDSEIPMVKRGFTTTLALRPVGTEVPEYGLANYVQVFKPIAGKYYATPAWLLRWMDAHQYLKIAYVDHALIDTQRRRTNVRVYKIWIEDDSAVPRTLGEDDRRLVTAVRKATKREDAAFFHFTRNPKDSDSGHAYVAERTGMKTKDDVLNAIARYREAHKKAVDKLMSIRNRLGDVQMIPWGSTCGYLCLPNKVKPIYTLYGNGPSDHMVVITVSLGYIAGQTAGPSKDGKKNLPTKIWYRSEPCLLQLPNDAIDTPERDEDSIINVVLLGRDGRTTNYVLKQTSWNHVDFSHAKYVFTTSVKLGAPDEHSSPIRSVDFERDPVRALTNPAPERDPIPQKKRDQWKKRTFVQPNTRAFTSRQLYSMLKAVSFWNARARKLAAVINSMPDVNDDLATKIEAENPRFADNALDDTPPVFNCTTTETHINNVLEKCEERWNDHVAWRARIDQYNDETIAERERMERDPLFEAV
jgi:hypothetical protein